ncbi:MAG: PIN domain-containing protein [bacterium]
MPAALADTNVVSELLRSAPNVGVLGWLARNERFVLSAVTIEEMAYGLAVRPQPHLERRWHAALRSRIDVLPVTEEIARRAGGLRAERRLAGRTCSPADMLIVATAAMNGMTLVTRNVRDFVGCGVKLENPFT